MADVAATAAGLISLGIQVCNGLVAYYTAYRDADHTIQSMLDTSNDLTKTLVLISSRLADKTYLSSDVRQRIEECVLACETNLTKLEKKLAKVALDQKTMVPANNPAAGKGAKCRAILTKASRKALYPFKESTIVKIKELCSDCREDLQLALDILNIDLTMSSLSKIDDLSVQVVEVTDGVRNVKAELTRTGDGVRTLLVRQQDAAVLQAIEWLSPLQGTFQRRQQEHYNVNGRQDRSGQLLIRNSDFQHWATHAGQILWCVGAPGIGKTVTASYVVNHLQHVINQGTVGIAYAYCSYKDTGRETAINLLSNMLQQFLLQDCPFVSALLDLFQAHAKQKTRPSLPEIMDLLYMAVRAFDRTYIVIDALDECSDMDGNREDLVTELTSLLPNISLLIVSRPLPNLECYLAAALRVELKAQDEDIIEYVKERVASSRRLHAHLRKDPGLIHTITQKVLKKVKGMFLMARLYLDSLSKVSTLRRIKETLETLPDGLTEVYDDCIARIQSQSTEDAAIATRTLHWIHHAVRPLTVSELQCALAVQPGDKFLDRDGEPDRDLLISVCAGLVVVEKETDAVALVHYTAQEYLQARNPEFLAGGQLDLAQTCVSHLLFDEFAHGPDLSDHDLEEKLAANPLLRYASQYWGAHFDKCSQEMPEEVANLAVDLLTQQARVEMIHQISNVPDFKLPGYSQSFAKGINGLSLAASLGLTELVTLLLTMQQGDSMLNTQDSDGRSPIHHAIMRKGVSKQTRQPIPGVMSKTKSWDLQKSKTADITDLLLAAGSSPVIADATGQTPLHYAAAYNQTAAISTLVSRGASNTTTAVDGYNGTPLYRAVEAGHTASVRMLLDLGSDVLIQNSYKQTLLHRAAEEDHVMVLQILIDWIRAEKGEEELRRVVGLKDYYGWTAKYRAADHGHTEIATLLTAAAGPPRRRVKPGTEKTTIESALKEVRASD